MNLPALFTGALGEASSCAPTPGSRLDTTPAPTTIRELYVDLKTASTERQPQECVNAAFIKGMLRPLGPEYRYHPIGEEQPKNAPEPPTTSLANKSIVYVKFPGFLTGGRKTVEDALRTARSDHTITGLILDLRGVDGASLDELALFLDLFLDEGVALESRNRRTLQTERIFATRLPSSETVPMIILVDENTRSGAEAVASSLRAHGKTLLIGRRTRGLAAVDTVIDLPSGSRLVVPIGDLLDTQGGTISGRGVQPDIDLSSHSPLHDGEAVDEGIRLAVQVFSATRSGTRADLLDAAHRIVAASVTAK